MILGAACCALYVCTLIVVIEWVVLLGSVIVGIGGAILWVSNGSYIIKNSTETTRGFYTGLFWTVFQLGSVLGPLAANFIINPKNITLFYEVFAAIAVAGVLILLFSRNPPKQIDDEHVETSLSARDIFINTISLLRDTRIQLLGLMWFWSGYEQGYWGGEFPLLLKPEQICIIFLCLGAAEIISGITIGKISDRYGRSIAMIIGSTAYMIGIVLSTFLKINVLTSVVIGTTPLIAYVSAILMGIGDSVFNTQNSAIIGDFYPMQTLGVFTLYQLFQNIGLAVGYFIGIPFPMHGPNGTLIQIWIQVVILTVGAGLYIFVDLKYQRPKLTVYTAN